MKVYKRACFYVSNMRVMIIIMMTIMMLMCLLLTAECTEYSRVVITFRSAAYNTLEAVELLPEDMTVVKQYGRRMVLHLGNDSSLADALWINGIWGGEDVVERVEPDFLVGMEVEEDSDNNNNEQLEIASAAALVLPWNLDPLEPYGMHLTPSLTNKNTSTVVVALLDSGLSAAGTVMWKPVGGFCFISSPEYSNTGLGRNPDFTDPGDQGPTCPTSSWHGTKVASIVKAISPNAKLSILRVLGRCGSGFASDVTDAIVWAAGGGINGVKGNPFPAKVVSMSLAGKGLCPTYMQSAVNQAIALGAIIIAAAGNAGANATLYFPGNCKGVLSIGASTRQGTLASYSNWGETLAFSAPGGDAGNPIQVMTVGLDAQLTVTTAVGTSFAAPHVAGVVLLLQAANMSLEKGGLYVPCVGGCWVMGILNGVSVTNGLDNKLAAYMISQQQHLTASNESQVTMAGETCAYGYDTSTGADRYGGEYQYRTYCGAGEFVYAYVLCVSGSYVEFACFSCMDQTGTIKATKYIGNTAASCSVFPVTAYSTNGFFKYAHGLQTSAIANKAGSWLMSFGARASEQSCQNDEIIVGFHGWNGASLDESKIYCRKTCNCAAGQYNNNGLCLNCPSGKYSGSAGAYGCNSCGAGSYSPGGGVSCSACNAESYSSTEAGSCTLCSACTAGTSYEISACTATTNRQCAGCSACASGSYETTTCTTTRNRGCTACSAVCSVNNYETTACTSSSNRRCDTCQSCPDVNGIRYYRLGCGGSLVGTCNACGACASGSYRTGCTGTSPGTCQPCLASNYCVGGSSQPTPWTSTTCNPGTYMTTVPSFTANIQCTTCEAGYFCVGGTSARTACTKGSYCLYGSPQPTNCNKGTYSATDSASAPGVCLSCNAGYFSGANGATVCEICIEGSASTTGASVCTPCNLPAAPITAYQDQKGQSTCKTCVVKSCGAGQTSQLCTPISDYSCTACESIANCRYQGGSGCFTLDVPTCVCDAGFEKTKISSPSVYRCVQCGQGKYKHDPVDGNCTNWGALSCGSTQYVAKGTRTATSACLNYPSAPDNAFDEVQTQTWTCNKGFEKLS